MEAGKLPERCFAFEKAQFNTAITGAYPDIERLRQRPVRAAKCGETDVQSFLPDIYVIRESIAVVTLCFTDSPRKNRSRSSIRSSAISCRACSDPPPMCGVRIAPGRR